MPTQKEIAQALDLSQQEVSRTMEGLGIDWRATPLPEIIVAYVRKLRGAAAGHRSGDLDLVAERVKTERVDRELKELQLAEKRGELVNLAQLEPALTQMVVAFRSEVLSLADKTKTDLDALYGIDIDQQVLNALTHDALDQLARYDPERVGAGASVGEAGGATLADDHDGVGPSAPQAQP